MIVTVFAGGSELISRSYASIAADVGKVLAELHLNMRYGGGKFGCMKFLLDAFLKNGGKLPVESIVYRPLLDNGRAQYRTDNKCSITSCDTLEERKRTLLQGSTLALAIPGGAGTLDEISHVLQMHEFGESVPKLIIYNYDGFFDGLSLQLEKCHSEAFFRQSICYEIVHDCEELKAVIEKELR